MPLTNLEVETLTAVRSAARKISNDVIDWEERRYELVKTIAPTFIRNGQSPRDVANSAVEYADAIIEKLRKTAE